jgi:CheY-like chemotaxis protein
MTFADQPLQLAVFAAGSAAVDDWQVRPPAVLIADIAMQPPDGYALARELRAHPAGDKAAVILLAGQTDVVDEAAAAETRASAVLRKPLDSHQLIDAVRQALRSGPPPAVVPVGQPAAVASTATAVAAAVAEPEAGVATAPPPLDVEPDVQGVVADVARVMGRESVPDGDATAGPWGESQSAGAAADGLADTFHALLEVEQGIRPALPPVSLADDDVDRIALRVAGVVGTDAALAARIESAILTGIEPAAATAAERAVERLAPELVAAIAGRVVREIAPALVERIAHVVVREEIARLRGAARVA